MTFGFWLRVFLLLSVWPSARCAEIASGAIEVECQDRSLVVLINLSFAGSEPRFEAVDATGVYPITKQYGSECGYTFSIVPLPRQAELRASYFSCHTDNKNEEVFSFNFNLITTNGSGDEVIYVVNKTCSLPLPWSPREVTCEKNYMEVSVRSDVSCPSGTTENDWNEALAAAHGSSTSDWQVMFQKEGQQLTPMSLSEARGQGYVFDITAGRLVFRSPYGQPHSAVTTVNGVSVEVVHPTLFSKQRWVVMMVDLVAACTMNEGLYDGARLVWETPTLPSTLVSSLSGVDVSMGVNSQLLDEPIPEQRGYTVDITNTTVQISIPFNAEGGYRQSFVMDNMYHEFYMVFLCCEQLFQDEGGVETRLRLLRPMATPLLPQLPFTTDQTVLEERVFTVYLGNVPNDVDLVAVKLNGQEFPVPQANSSYPIAKVSLPNDTHAYILRVPFEDPIVPKLYSTEGILQYLLDINYTLTILPQVEPYYHLASVVTQFKDVFPPAFNGICTKGGISFKMDHQPFDYLWEVGIGMYPLTPELAAQRGYNIQNNNQSLIVDVPLFTIGYTYEDIMLKQFFGTFEILFRLARTLEIKTSSVKRCLFQTTELIVCSTDGDMTVVTDVTLAIPGAIPSRTSLLDKTCSPKETDDTRVLFNFAMNTCGTRVKVDQQYVTYENEIFFEQGFTSVKRPLITRDYAFKLTVQCVYPLTGLHKLFAERRFEAEAPGLGTILKTKVPVKGTSHIIQPTVRTTTLRMTTPRTTTSTTTRIRAVHPSAKYIRVFKNQHSRMAEVALQ